MSISEESKFEEFANPTKSTLRSLVNAMFGPGQKLNKLRNDFKQSIEEYFALQAPFPTYGQEIEDDIEQYVKLVSYCLEAGDTQILSKWGIDAIKSNPAGMLVSENFQEYLASFEVGREESETRLEEDCWTMLSSFFSSLAQPHNQVSKETVKHLQSLWEGKKRTDDLAR